MQEYANSAEKILAGLSNLVKESVIQDISSEIESYLLYPHYEQIVEKYQWVINEEGSPTLVHGEITAIAEDRFDNTQLIKHTNPAKALFALRNLNTPDYIEYLSQFK